MAHRHPKRNKTSRNPSTRAEFPWVRYVAPDHEDRPSMLCTLGHESSKRMVWLTIPCKLLRKDKLLEHQLSRCKADVVQVEAMAAAARHSGGISASVEGVGLFATVRGTFKNACTG